MNISWHSCSWHWYLFFLSFYFFFPHFQVQALSVQLWQAAHCLLMRQYLYRLANAFSWDNICTGCPLPSHETIFIQVAHYRLMIQYLYRLPTAFSWVNIVQVAQCLLMRQYCTGYLVPSQEAILYNRCLSCDNIVQAARCLLMQPCCLRLRVPSQTTMLELAGCHLTQPGMKVECIKLPWHVAVFSSKPNIQFYPFQNSILIGKKKKISHGCLAKYLNTLVLLCFMATSFLESHYILNLPAFGFFVTCQKYWGKKKA